VGTIAHVAIVGIFFIMIMGLVGNTTSFSDNSSVAGNAFIGLQCPMPDGNGAFDELRGIGPANNNTRRSLTYNWNETKWVETGDGRYLTSDGGVATALNTQDGISCSPVHTFGQPEGCGQTNGNGCDYLFGSPTVALGVLFYAVDYIAEFFHKLASFFVLVGSLLSPVDWTIFGLTIDDLDTTVQSFLWGGYIFFYTFIGAWVYKVVSPFTGE
jgi:hypothetical protein